MSDLLWESFKKAEVFWVMVTALLTFALVAVAWWQLKNLSKTSRSDFLYRLKKDFFTEIASEFIFLIEYDLLVFSAHNFPHFDTVEKHGIRPEKDMFVTSAIDQVLLGPLEDVGVMWKAKKLTLKEVYEPFDYYIRLCVENKAIRDYIAWARKEDDENDDIYDHLFLLYAKLIKEGPKIRARKRTR